jgi:hypothetical protein
MLMANVAGPDVFIAFFILALWAGEAVAAGAIANSKGRGWGYFWAGLFLGIFGIIWAALLRPSPAVLAERQMAANGAHMGAGAPGPGWWLASDGRWYPPQASPHYPPPPTARSSQW